MTQISNHNMYVLPCTVLLLLLLLVLTCTIFRDCNKLWFNPRIPYILMVHDYYYVNLRVTRDPGTSSFVLDSRSISPFTGWE